MSDQDRPLALDPDIARFLRLISDAALPDPTTIPLADARANAKRLRTAWNRGGPKMARSEDVEIAGLSCRVHRPVEARGESPFTLYLHGGGWTLLDIDTHDRIGRTIAAKSAHPVLLVDYPLSPEAPFPIAIDRLADLIAALAEDRARFRLDVGRMGFAGDSAGANLALGLALRLRDSGRRLPVALGLFYGAYGGSTSADSFRRYGDGRLPLSTARTEWFWRNYLPEPADWTNPLSAQLHADLSGLPPSFLSVAPYDVLYDENLALAARLGAAGNEMRLTVYPGTIHGFIEAAGAVGAAVGERALGDMGAFLSQYLGRPV
jgi:acetyl esterase